MKCTRNVTDHVIWVGANDRRLNLFENLFPIPRGVSYNAYLIKDEKNALMDTVDASASEQFIENSRRKCGFGCTFSGCIFMDCRMFLLKNLCMAF